MSEENSPQKERYLREVEQKLLRRDLDATLLEDGLIHVRWNEQRLFSDEQIAVIKNACEFALEDDATLSYAEEKQLHNVQEQIGQLLPEPEQEQQPTMEQTM